MVIVSEISLVGIRVPEGCVDFGNWDFAICCEKLDVLSLDEGHAVAHFHCKTFVKLFRRSTELTV